VHLREKRNGQENEKTNQAGRWQGRRARRFEDPLLVFVSDRGPRAPVGAVSGKRKQDEPEKKEKAQNKIRGNVASRPRTRRGGGHIPERGERGGGVVLQRQAKNEGHGGRRDAWQRDEGNVRKRGAVSERKRKGKKYIKTHQVVL
jgi:hypothetical protein